MARFFSALAGAILGLQTLPLLAQSWTPAKESIVSNAVGQIVPAHTPSLALGISINGNPVFTRGFGFIAPGIEASPETIYHIGSITKQFTAAAILELMTDQAVNRFRRAPFTLDDEVASLFDGVAHWGNLTVRDLLTMTAGLPNYTEAPPPGTDPRQPISSMALLGALKTYPRNPFGFYYSNTNYFLLAQAVEVWTQAGDPAARYEDFIRSRIFARAGMSKTGFIGQYTEGSQVAPPTFAAPPTFSLPDWPKGAGNIASSVVDLLKWNRALMVGEVINAAALNEMFKEATSTNRPGVNYGMGWYIIRTPLTEDFFHDGGVSGYRSFTGISRRRSDGATVSVAILTNADNVPGLEQLGGWIVRLVHQ